MQGNINFAQYIYRFRITCKGINNTAFANMPGNIDFAKHARESVDFAQHARENIDFAHHAKRFIHLTTFCMTIFRTFSEWSEAKK